MNATLRAVIVELSGGNIRNDHINLRGTLGMFPDDSLGGSNKSASAKPIRLQFGKESVETDIDEGKAIFRERSAVKRFFLSESVVESDLILIEKLESRSYRLSKVSKRVSKYYL
jgi:hypothetical protein